MIPAVKKTISALVAAPLFLSLAACGGGADQTEFSYVADDDNVLPAITVNISCDDSGTVVTEGHYDGENIRDISGGTETIEYTSRNPYVNSTGEGHLTVTPDSGKCRTKVLDSGADEQLDTIESSKEITIDIEIPMSTHER